MLEFLSSDQMRALENAAIDSGSVTASDLMSKAGEAVVEAIYETWSMGRSDKVAIVFCGPGNNGGDGFAVSLLLRTRGWNVTVFFYGSAPALSPAARSFHDQWVALDDVTTHRLSYPGVTLKETARLKEVLATTPYPTLIIDALFGIGLSRPLSGLSPVMAEIEDYRAKSGTISPNRSVAVDLPSGLAEAGPLGPVFPVDMTVTFHMRKEAHRQGPQFCGHIVVKDIGL